MVNEENFDEEFEDNEDSNENEDFEEQELENIIEDAPEIDLGNAVLEPISPVLQPREVQSLEQEVANVPIISQETEEEKEGQGVYGLSNQTGYDAMDSDYLSSASNDYEIKTQTPDGSPTMSSNRIQDQFSNTFRQQLGQQAGQEFQQQERQYDTDIERKLQQDRKRMF